MSDGICASFRVSDVKNHALYHEISIALNMLYLLCWDVELNKIFQKHTLLFFAAY